MDECLCNFRRDPNFQMEDWQKEALRRHRKAILDDLYIDFIVDHLISTEILKPHQYEFITHKIGRLEQARCLLDMLPNLGPKAYSEFVASLRKPYSWLAEVLSQEKGESSLNGCVMTNSISSSSVENVNIQADRLSEQIRHSLITISCVCKNFGTSLTALGESLGTLVQSMELLNHIKAESATLVRKNSKNISHTETIENMSKSKEDCDSKVQNPEENVITFSRCEEINTSHGKIHCTTEISQENTKFIENEKIINGISENESNLEKCIISDSTSTVTEDLILQVGKNSSQLTGPCIGSPDSAINMEVTSGMISPDENKSNLRDGDLNDATSYSQNAFYKNMSSNMDELNSLQHSIVDVMHALKTTVIIADRTLELAGSISN